MDVQKLYETLTGHHYPGDREGLPKDEWPLARRLVWLAAYLALFAVLAALTLPHG